MFSTSLSFFWIILQVIRHRIGTEPVTGVGASRPVSGKCVRALSDARCSSVRLSRGVRVVSGWRPRCHRAQGRRQVTRSPVGKKPRAHCCPDSHQCPDSETFKLLDTIANRFQVEINNIHRSCLNREVLFLLPLLKESLL